MAREAVGMRVDEGKARWEFEFSNLNFGLVCSELNGFETGG